MIQINFELKNTEETITYTKAVLVDNSSQILMKKLYSLLMLRKGDEILLGYKKRGFGKGKWNGFGGKIEKGENPEEAAVREMKEECGLDVAQKNIEKIGLIEFSFVGEPILMEVHIFAASQFMGLLTESEEMMPRWFKIKDIPYDCMWADDRIWYPLMLSGNKFKGHVQFKGEEMLHHTIQSVDTV